MITKNAEITQLSETILEDLTNVTIPLHIVMLKAARLALMVNMPDMYKWLIDNAQSAEKSEVSKSVFQVRIESAKDPSISVASANPHENIGFSVRGNGNQVERNGIVKDLESAVKWAAFLRNETFKFVLNVYNKWRFGNTAENIFDQKRARIEPGMLKVLPDIEQRLNSIEQNLNSDNPEDWKNAVSSCRALFMDIADNINPSVDKSDKSKYLDRIKNFISPKLESKTKTDLLTTLLEELKSRIELTLNLTQGSAHRERPSKQAAQDVVLYTYLALGEIAELYIQKEEDKTSITESEPKNPS